MASRADVAALRAPAGLAALARGGLPAQQPRARRALLRRLLGHVLPADLRGGDGPPGVGRAAVVRPLHDAAGAGARAAVRHRPADRLAAGDRREPAPQLRVPGRRRGAAPCSSCCSRRRDRARRRAADVRVRARSCSAPSGRSSGAACARGGRWRASRCRVALVSLVRAQPAPLRRLPRPRRASRCCSSASPRRRRSRRRSDVAARARARARTVGDYALTYVQADGAARAPPATAGSSGSTSAPSCAVARGGRTPATLHDLQVLLPVARTRRSGRCRASSRARRRARSACAPGCARDVWTRGRAGHRPAAAADRPRATSVFARRRTACTPEQRGAFLAAGAARASPPPTPRPRRRPRSGSMVSPLVTLDLDRRADRPSLGGLHRLLAAPRGRAQPRASARYAARVAREVARPCVGGIRARPRRRRGRRRW